MDIVPCPTCGAGLVDRVVKDSRSERPHAERVGVKCSNPHCGYRAGTAEQPAAAAAAGSQP